MKKIVFHLNSLERGGAERVVTNLAGQFAEEGYEVYIATEWTGEDEYALNSKVHRVHVGLTDIQQKHNRAIKFIDRIINLKKFIKEVEPDVVIAFAKRANYRALTSTFFMTVPVIISVRINPIGWYDSFTDKLQTAILFPRARGAVFQTKEQQEFFPRVLQKKSKIILNPINDKFIGNNIPENREKSVVHSGRLVDFKNQQMLIRAFLEVHKKHPDYILKIYGPDSGDGTKEILEKIISENNAGEYIKLMGGSDKLHEDLITGAVAAFSSDYEGMPNAMLEAMALGLPVVATDCPPGGPAMVIQNEKNGLLVPVGDKNKMAEAICRLIENKDFAAMLGENASKIKDIASTKKIYEEWKNYLEERV